MFLVLTALSNTGYAHDRETDIGSRYFEICLKGDMSESDCIMVLDRLAEIKRDLDIYEKRLGNKEGKVACSTD